MPFDPTLPNLSRLSTLMRQVARAEILPRFERVSHHFKDDGSILTEADLAVNHAIARNLQQEWPNIQFLSEEMEVQEQANRLKSVEYLWCLDPLDGTSNFAAGIPLFASSLALIYQGEVVLGITYDPIRDELFATQKGKGAWLNGARLQCRPSPFILQHAIALIDFKRLKQPLLQGLLREKPFGSQRNLGSCTLELAWIAANRGQVYLHGGMKLWDLAAGALLIAEAGGQISSIEGTAVFEASLGVHSVLAAPDEALFQAWLRFVQAHSSRNYSPA